MKEYKRLEDYGIIGDMQSCALVSNDGSIDWFCLPHIESPSVFARILDFKKGGHFSVRPSRFSQSKQEYIPRTNVLKTFFTWASGKAVLTDFMPISSDGKRPVAIIRKFEIVDGISDVEILFHPLFNYALAETTLHKKDKNIIAANQKKQIYLHTPFDFKIVQNSAAGKFNLKQGDFFWLVLQYQMDRSWDDKQCQLLLKETIVYWQAWSHNCEEPGKCVFGGPWHDLVVRSGLVLKLLTHRETGAICAAPTTSLPEEIGGVRNWDYRFNWIRDASFTVQALHNLGHVTEASEFLNWFVSICKNAGHPSKLQIMYGLHSEENLQEKELAHFSGYRNSRPVRIGNGAAHQKQWDIYGELVNAVWEVFRYGQNISDDVWKWVIPIVDYVMEIWNTPDAGIWEVRSGEQHFTYSKLMCWVALDRGIQIAGQRGETANVQAWKQTRAEIYTTILEKGFNQRLNSFVQAFDSTALDATSLLIPMTGFLPFHDPRVMGTIDAALEHLTTDEGLVYRYKNEDGLSGEEGVFILCTFWLIDSLILSGRAEEGKRVFQNVLKYVNPVGLLAEEIDPKTGEQLGNFPQAFSHVGLINSALYLGRNHGKNQMGPQLLGV